MRRWFYTLIFLLLLPLHVWAGTQLASSFSALGWSFTLQQRVTRCGYYQVTSAAGELWYAVVEYRKDEATNEKSPAVDGSQVWMCPTAPRAQAHYEQMKQHFGE